MLGREARPPGCFEALGWDCAPSLLPRGGAEPPPRAPSFPDPASRGVMSGARRAEWEGRREAGGGTRWRERLQPRERPRPPAAPGATRAKFGAEPAARLGESARNAPRWPGRVSTPSPPPLWSLRPPFLLQPSRKGSERGFWNPTPCRRRPSQALFSTLWSCPSCAFAASVSSPGKGSHPRTARILARPASGAARGLGAWHIVRAQ